MALALLLLKPVADAQEPVETLVKPPPARLIETPPGGLIPEAILRHLGTDQTAWPVEQRRLGNEAQANIQARLDREASERSQAGREFRSLREQAKTRARQFAAGLKSSLDAASQRNRERLEVARWEHAATKARWDAEASWDLREFRKKNEAELARRIADGERMGKMLVSLFTGGSGMDGGGLTSLLGGLGGTEGAGAAATLGPSAVGEVAATLAGGEAAAADVGALLTSEGISGDDHSPLLASLGGREEDLAILQAIGSSSPDAAEVAYRPMPYRPPVRPFLPRTPPRPRDPVRNPPVFSPRPSPPIIDRPAKQRLDGLSEFLDGFKDKAEGLEAWKRVTGGPTGRPLDLRPERGWHPPMAWVSPSRPDHDGSQFTLPNGPRYGDPIRIRNPWLEDPEYDLYWQSGLDGQQGRAIPIPRF